MLNRSRLHEAQTRIIAPMVGWLTPKRVRVYPTLLILGVLVYLTWQTGLALWLGLPYYLTGGLDFMAFYTGGRFFLEGRLADLYDFSAQRAFQASLLAPVVSKARSPFINPPFTVALYAPFALGSYGLGLLLWWGAGLLAFTLSLRLIRQTLLPPSGPSTGRLFLTSFLFFPTLAWFLYGQSTALTLLLYTLTFVLLRRERDFTAGLALGCLLYKPQLAVALGVMLLVKRRWWALLGGALSAGLWLVIGFALSPAAMQEYARMSPMLFELLRSGMAPMDPRWGLQVHYPTWGIQSFFGFAVLLLDGFWKSGADLLAAVLTLGGVLGVVFWWRRMAWQPGTRAWDFTMAATLALGLLISPHLFLYDLMLLLLPLAIVWSYYPRGTEARHLDGGPLLAWTALLYGATFVGSYLTLGELFLSTAVGLPKLAVQWSTLIIAGWAWVVSRFARNAEKPSSITGPGDDAVLLSVS